LFLGQVSYGLGNGDYYGDEDEFQIYRDAGATVTHYDSLKEYATAHNIDGVIDKDGDGTFSNSEIASYLFGFEISTVTTFAGETAYILSDGTYLLLSGLLNDIVVVNTSTNNHSSDSNTTTIPYDPTNPDPCIGCPDPTDPDLDSGYTTNPETCTKTCDSTKEKLDLANCTCVCNLTCPSGYKLNTTNCECVKLDPCFGFSTTNIDIEEILEGLEIQGILQKAGLASLSGGFIDAFKQLELIDTSEISRLGEDILKGKEYFGKAVGIANIIYSGVKYIDTPSTQNLLRFAFDGATSNPTTVATLGLGVSLVELYKFDGGETVIDKILKEVSNQIDLMMDCNLGEGVRLLILGF
jgi:hypothetical protein